MSSDQHSNQLPAQGRLAGVDFGTVRVGLAVSDPGRRLASPCATYTRRDPSADARYFKQFAASEGIVGWVVGLPVHMSGDESQKSREARRFGDWLAKEVGLPVVYFDERYSTAHAMNLMHEAQVRRSDFRKHRDKLAAQIILSAYLESAAKGGAPPAAPQPLE